MKIIKRIYLGIIYIIFVVYIVLLPITWWIPILLIGKGPSDTSDLFLNYIFDFAVKHDL